MTKESIEIICPMCGAKTAIDWPTSRALHAATQCPSCKASFPVAEAVEETILGRSRSLDRHGLRSVSKRKG